MLEEDKHFCQIYFLVAEPQHLMEVKVMEELGLEMLPVFLDKSKKQNKQFIK
jgi:hypothetical protein